MKLGERLQKERNKLNITQSEVAEKLRVSRQTISNWETNKSYPDLESLVSLSDYYNISLDVLLKEDDGMIKDINKKLKFIGILKPILYVLCCLLGLICIITPIPFVEILMEDTLNINSLINNVVAVIKIALMFLLVFYFLKVLKPGKTKYYKRLSIISAILLVFALVVKGQMTIGLGPLKNLPMELIVLYLIISITFAHLYSISPDENKEVSFIENQGDSDNKEL